MSPGGISRDYSVNACCAGAAADEKRGGGRGGGRGRGATGCGRRVGEQRGVDVWDGGTWSTRGRGEGAGKGSGVARASRGTLTLGECGSRFVKWDHADSLKRLFVRPLRAAGRSTPCAVSFHAGETLRRSCLAGLIAGNRVWFFGYNVEDTAQVCWRPPCHDPA